MIGGSFVSGVYQLHSLSFAARKVCRTFDLIETPLPVVLNVSITKRGWENVGETWGGGQSNESNSSWRGTCHNRAWVVLYAHNFSASAV
jgi:hypothetical protein